MSTAVRKDVRVVPDYREFVRHVWAYDDIVTGPVISGPPWVYGCVIEHPDEWALIQRVLERPWAAGRMSVEKAGIDARLVRFSSLEALHDFLRILSRRHKLTGDRITKDVVEFVMWTLGFRWV